MLVLAYLLNRPGFLVRIRLVVPCHDVLNLFIFRRQPRGIIRLLLSRLRLVLQHHLLFLWLPLAIACCTLRVGTHLSILLFYNDL